MASGCWPAAAAAPVHKVIVIDGSYSMDYRGESTTTFARAKQLAARLVRDSRQGDVFTVIQMGRAAKTIVGPEVIDHATVATQIEALAESHAAADLAGALSLVHESLADDKSSRKLPDQKEVIIFTDLQRSTWARPGFPRGAWERGRQRVRASRRRLSS